MDTGNKFVVVRAGGPEVGEMDVGSRKVQTSYKINKSWE